MKIILTLLILHCGFSVFSQGQLERLGTVAEINARAEATNIQPLLVVQNVVYAIPEDCFCKRSQSDHGSGRGSGDDDSGRNKDSKNTDRNAGNDDTSRNSGGDESGRNLGTDFIYREVDDSNNGRNSGSDDSSRRSDSANTGRRSDSANAERKSAGASDGRESGNAANGRDASGDNLGRSFATSFISPACSKKKDSCSIEITGFHPKAKMEYFDKVESIKAVEMVIPF